MPDVLELGELVVVEALDLQMRGAREVLVSVDVFEKTEIYQHCQKLALLERLDDKRNILRERDSLNMRPGSTISQKVGSKRQQ